MRHPALVFGTVCALLAWGTPALADDAGAMSLAQALAQAKSTAPQILAASARVDEASANVSTARAGYLPVVSAGLRGTGSGTQDTFLFATTKYVSYTASAEAAGSIRWTMWDLGKTSNNVTSAERAVAANEAVRKASTQGVIADTASAYISVVIDEQLVEVARTTVKNRARYAAIAHGMVGAGVRSPIDELRAKVALETARLDVSKAEAQASSDRARLATLLWLDPTRPVEVKRTTLPQLDDSSLRSAATTAVESRPEVVAAKEDVASRDSALDAARAGYRPSLSLAVDGSYRVTSRDFVPVMIPSQSGTAMLVFGGALFDATIGARVDAAGGRVAESKANLSGTRAAVKTQAVQATIALRSAKLLLEQARHVAEGSAAALSVLEARFASGLASATDLLDVESVDAAARATAVAAEGGMALATIRLLAATGKIESLL
jgi:outer membrane protein TolC